MTRNIIYTFVLPNIYTKLLLYNDCTGLFEKEKKELFLWLKNMRIDSFSHIINSPVYYSKNNDLNSSPGLVKKFCFIKTIKN